MKTSQIKVLARFGYPSSLRSALKATRSELRTQRLEIIFDGYCRAKELGNLRKKVSL